MLSVSGEGNFRLRKLAAAWERAAPREVSGWQYLPAREPKPDALRSSIDYQGQRLAIAQMKFDIAADLAHARLDVKAYHPVLARMSEEVRVNTVFIVLDTLLGEDDVERWLSYIGGFLGLATGATWNDMFAWCATPAPYEGYADISIAGGSSGACPGVRLAIHCL